MFTGRTKALKTLGEAIFSPHTSTIQRRFVLYGLGGSGKTELCCKFAQDHQQLFWGVFWIDATDPIKVKQSFANIGKLGGVESSQESAKNWLSGLDRPWLLLIENCNAAAGGINLPDLFPGGQRGCVLVTTRNPSYQVHGTIGSRALQLDIMESHEANELLLTAASILARDELTEHHATAISETLGYLPLALVHAGSAILAGLSSLGEYLQYFWGQLHKLREGNNIAFKVNKSDQPVYSTFEVFLDFLEKQRLQGHVAAADAVDLLKLFCFLSWEDMHPDILTTAAQNHKLAQSAGNTGPKTTYSWTTDGLKAWLSSMITDSVTFILTDRSPAILPAILRDFSLDRLNGALALLTQFSLIKRHRGSGSYSMHPIVHIWIRERPGMRDAEQAMWCQTTSYLLSQCVQLPPLGTSKEDLLLRVRLVPHVSHVQKCHEQISLRLQTQRERRKWLWPSTASLVHQYDRVDALIAAKFSLVFFEGGLWKEAESLQRGVLEYCRKMLGLNHARTIEITLFLSHTLSHQTRANDAAALQEQALAASEAIFGPEAAKTLKVMDMLATSYMFGGKLQAAKVLYKDAIEKLGRTKGESHEDTLLVKDNLGRLLMRYQQHVEAEALHEKAEAGLRQILGSWDMRTLASKESLAMARLELKGSANLQSARELMEYVLDERKKQLGKEQPYTLLAMCNLARVQAAVGETAAAETLMLSALKVAERNLGPCHQGVLMGKAHLANVYVLQKRYQKAEDMLVSVTDPANYTTSARDDGGHPDRIAALWYLMSCFITQGKTRDALRVNYELYEAIMSMGGEGLGKDHIIAKKTLEKRQELEVAMRAETI